MYSAATLLTGMGFKIPIHSSSGAVRLNFPYTSTDDITGITTNQIFHSNRGSVVSNNVQPYWLFFEYELGGLKHFYSLNFSAGKGFGVSTGYGFMWYFNGFGEHKKNVVNKRYVFKASMNIGYEQFAGRTLLGTIDNSNKTIGLLGYAAEPTFDITTSIDNGDGTTSYETDTYSAQDLNVSYSQTEWLLIPKISIGNNPYRSSASKNAGNSSIHKKHKRINKLLWDLSLGYNIPFSNKGGLQLTQDDGSGNSAGLNSSLVSLNTPGVAFMYNGKPTTSTLFHLSGLFISLSLRMGGSKRY
jgi:hypothetical protein